ncbi:MAG TPA: hypothetical protein ENI22_00640 [Candidatus Pacearchaeota archaeon]|nr:hypothetical protein [Candidatus Pacearchaeota archaeon]
MGFWSRVYSGAKKVYSKAKSIQSTGSTSTDLGGDAGTGFTSVGTSGGGQVNWSGGGTSGGGGTSTSGGTTSSGGGGGSTTETEQSLQMSLPADLRNKSVAEVTKKLNLRGTTLQQQAALRQSLPGRLPKGTPVGSAPGGTIVADGRGGTIFMPKSRRERKQESFATAYEKSIEEQTKLKSGQVERKVKVQKFSDSQFNYYQNLVNKNQISVEEATSKYKQAIYTYDRDLLERSLGGATLAGMSTVQGESFSVIPSIEQAKIAKAAGKKAAKGVKFTKQDAMLLVGSVLSLGPDIAKGTGRTLEKAGEDIRYFGKEAKRIVKSPQSFQEGKAMEIAGIWGETKTSKSLRGGTEAVVDQIMGVPAGAVKTGFYAGEFGYEKITGKKAKEPDRFMKALKYDSNRKIYQDPQVKSAAIVAAGFGTGVVFKSAGAVTKAAAGARVAKIASVLGWGFAGVAGTAYAYGVREEIRLAQTPEEKGKVFGKTASQAALFGGGMIAGSKLTGKAIAGLTPRVYSDPLMVDVKVPKPVSKTGLPKQRNIFIDATGKRVVLDRNLQVNFLADVGFAGRQPRLSTPFREALGLQPKYVGGTARINSAAYKKALKSLKKQGYTDYQAREALKLRRPQYQRTTIEGEMDLIQVEEQPLQRLMSGKQVTEFLPGQKGGVKFLRKKPITKKITEEAMALGEDKISFQLVEENLARPLGKQTETFAGFGKGRKLGEAEAVDVILGSRQQEIFKISKNQIFDIFETTTIARRKIPSQRKILGGKGLALVERGEPGITTIDESIIQTRGFKGGGKKSSPEFFQKLYQPEQIMALPSQKGLKSSKTLLRYGKLESSKVAASGAISDSSVILSPGGVSDNVLSRMVSMVGVGKTPKAGKIPQPKGIKSPGTTPSYGVNSILSGLFGGVVIQSNTNIISDFSSGFSQGIKEETSATSYTTRQAPTQEGLGLLPTFSLKGQTGRLPTFSLNFQTLEPLRELSLSKLKQDTKTRSRSRVNIAAALSLITLQRQPQALKQPQAVKQQVMQQQRFFQSQSPILIPMAKYPIARPSKFPVFRLPPIRPPQIPFIFGLPIPSFGPRGGRRSRGARPPQWATRYTQTLSNIILFHQQAARLPRQRKYSGLEIRPMIVPQIPQRVPAREKSNKKKVAADPLGLLNPFGGF